MQSCPQLNNQVCLIEGLSRARTSNLRERLPTTGIAPTIHYPYIAELANDKFIKSYVFSRNDHRDCVAEMLSSLANRRSCFVSAVMSLAAAPPSVKAMVLNIHLLSSFSSLRSETSVDNWAQLVAHVFSDLMPGKIVYFNHRDEAGKLADDHRSWSYRSVEDVARDSDRRTQGLEALQKQIPTLKVLNLPMGIPADTELAMVKKFVMQGVPRQ